MKTLPQWPPFMGGSDSETLAFALQPDAKRLLNHFIDNIENWYDPIDDRPEWEWLVTNLGMANRALTAEKLDDACVAFFSIGAIFNSLSHPNEAFVKKIAFMNEVLADVVKTSKKNRQKRGVAKHEKSGFAELRQRARDEWPKWQPEFGKKTIAKFYREFYKIHQKPADESTMRRWLR